MAEFNNLIVNNDNLEDDGPNLQMQMSELVDRFKSLTTSVDFQGHQINDLSYQWRFFRGKLDQQRVSTVFSPRYLPRPEGELRVACAEIPLDPIVQQRDPRLPELPKRISRPARKRKATSSMEIDSTVNEATCTTTTMTIATAVPTTYVAFALSNPAVMEIENPEPCQDTEDISLELLLDSFLIEK